MATNIALYFLMLPSVACFILNIHLEEIKKIPLALGTISQTSLFIIDWYSFVVASFQAICLIASKGLVGYVLDKSFMFVV